MQPALLLKTCMLTLKYVLINALVGVINDLISIAVVWRTSASSFIY